MDDGRSVAAAEHGADLFNDEPAVVTVWSDIGCPWASLSLHLLRRTAADRGTSVVIDHRAFPLELFNRMSTPKPLVDAEIVVVAGRFPELQWRLWAGPTHAYPVTTLPALEAVQAAKAPGVGGLQASDQLDAALRRAFYIESRCIAVHSVIIDIAGECPDVDADALAQALSRGKGREAVFQQWRTAMGSGVQGSPHLFTAGGYTAHNPGATYHWTGRPPLDFPLQAHGFPVLDSYDASWVVQLLDALAVQTSTPTGASA